MVHRIFNRRTTTDFDSRFGLSGEYSAFNLLARLAYHLQESPSSL